MAIRERLCAAWGDRDVGSKPLNVVESGGARGNNLPRPRMGGNPDVVSRSDLIFGWIGRDRDFFRAQHVAESVALDSGLSCPSLACGDY